MEYIMLVIITTTFLIVKDKENHNQTEISSITPITTITISKY